MEKEKEIQSNEEKEEVEREANLEKEKTETTERDVILWLAGYLGITLKEKFLLIKEDRILLEIILAIKESKSEEYINNLANAHTMKDLIYIKQGLDALFYENLKNEIKENILRKEQLKKQEEQAKKQEEKVIEKQKDEEKSFSFFIWKKLKQERQKKNKKRELQQFYELISGEFNEEQLEQLKAAFIDGLPIKELKKIADVTITASRMQTLREVYQARRGGNEDVSKSI